MEAEMIWWKHAHVYQIYPLSFQDSNGDGIGDINGIIARLDHIQQLGIDVIWLSPVFQSPMKDNGYDVSDYREIHPWFGTKADLKKLLNEVHRRGMKIISDIVLNHTSDQHPWFIDALHRVDSPYRDFYIFRKNPNSIQSVFSGPAWTKVPNRDEYYFHFFAKEQPDLNWQNPQLRQELYRILREWLDFGFDGFRLDVIDLIGKDIDQSMISNGPFYQTYLKELKEQVFHDDKLFTVGELSGSTLAQAAAVTGHPNGIFSMAFQFSHLALDEQPDKGKWALKQLKVDELQATFQRIHNAYESQGWNALFMGNHDQPRPVSRYGSERHRYQSQTMLFLAFYGQRGTPFVYQGEEIGMLNYPFQSIQDYRDIESINYFHDQKNKLPLKTIMTSLRAKSRDHARTPMCWNDQQYAGFSTHEPWLPVHPYFPNINVYSDQQSPQSIQTFLRTLFKIRKDLIHVFTEGSLTYRSFNQPSVYAYERKFQETTLLFISSFASQSISLSFPDVTQWEVLHSNHPTLTMKQLMRIPPFFGVLLRKKSEYAHH